MTPKIGEVEALFRYPVKSMRGESLKAVALGWHGLDGDRRLALRRVDGSPVEMTHLNRGIFDEASVTVMINFDPDSARPAPEVLKAVVRERDNMAGIYGTVIRRGRLAVGQPVFLEPTAAHREFA